MSNKLFHGRTASDMPTYRPRFIAPPPHLTETERLYSLAAYGGLPDHDGNIIEFTSLAKEAEWDELHDDLITFTSVL